MSTTDEKVVTSKQDSNKLAEGDDIAPESGTPKSEEGETGDSPTPSEEKDRKPVLPPIMPEFQYTKEQLMAIKELPLSKKRPDCLLTSFNNSRGVWDPERWHLNQKRSETPPDDGGKGDAPAESHKRRSGDPRERIRKEQDGIVLSPQRRSFTTGCSMSQPPLVRRPESPIGKAERERDIIHREIPTRRIGSGRISARERDAWDFRLDRDKDPEPTGDFNSFQRGTNNRDRDNDRYERRSYGRDFSERGERDKDRHRNNNRSYGGGDRRRGYGDSREEEPEWFSAGPTSQHDTIELRGFEDIPEDQPKKPSGKATVKMNARTSGSRKSPPLKASTTVESPVKEAKPPRAPSPTEQHGPAPKSQKVNKSPTPERGSPKEPNAPSDGNDFNLDDFLKEDMLPELLTNGVDARGPANSRFSQYFMVDPPENRPDSRRNSLQDELLNNTMHDLTEQSTITIPAIGDSEAYFAPISPAANTSVIGSSAPAPPQTGMKPNSLLEMLQRSQGDRTKAPSIKDLTANGRIQSVGELEAQLRLQGLSNKNANSSVPKKSEEDLAAFQKLLAQVSDSKAVQPTTTNGPRPKRHNNSQPMSLLQMLSNKGGDDTGRPSHTTPRTEPPDYVFSCKSAGPYNNTNMHVPQELVMKLLEVQRIGELQRTRDLKRQQQRQKEMMEKLYAAQSQPQAASRQVPGFRHSLSPLPPDLQQMVHSVPPSQELLQRPEAQCIIQGLQRGELTSQHVVSQLQNPATQPRQREILANILKVQSQSGISPRANSPHVAPQPPDMLQHMMQQQQQQQSQQLRIPSPHNNAFCAPPPVISPNLTSNPNTLSVQHPVLPRIPSPHELVVHTQNIMQSALIKKKLEEQRENFRKRQEMQQSVSPNNLARIGDAPPQQKAVCSPTPLAFTPTSVLRKMTAEKDPEPSGMSGRNELKQPQFPQAQHRSPAVVLQQPQQRQQPQAQAQQSNTWNAPPAKQPAGRPIVKGSANFQTYTSADYQPSQIGMQPPSYVNNPPPTTYPSGHRPVLNVMMYARPPLNQISRAREQKKIHAHFFTQLQQSTPQLQYLPIQEQQAVISMSQNLAQNSLQQMLLNQRYNSSTPGSSNDGGMRQQSQPIPMRQSQSMNMHGGNDLSTSPTSNQLAQWFSPEILAQAKAGRLTGMPPISAMQNILSLEELERLQQSSATVHN